jgi:hypothetical protein
MPDHPPVTPPASLTPPETMADTVVSGTSASIFISGPIAIMAIWGAVTGHVLAGFLLLALLMGLGLRLFATNGAAGAKLHQPSSGKVINVVLAILLLAAIPAWLVF